MNSSRILEFELYRVTPDWLTELGLSAEFPSTASLASGMSEQQRFVRAYAARRR